MATTPPPPTRVKTPSTPLHGSRYEHSGPFSPRRSSRVAAQRSRADFSSSLSPFNNHDQLDKLDNQNFRFWIKGVNATTPGRQLFSPPSSPGSPAHVQATGKNDLTNLRNHQTPQRTSKRGNLHQPSDIMEGFQESPEHLKASKSSASMLPTPRKTPRKRDHHVEAGYTSGLLLPGRPMSVEDAMPSPRKSRKSKKHIGFTLNSFLSEDESNNNKNKIPIYTDTKERVPSLDQDEDNPFVGPPKTPRKIRNQKSSKARTEDITNRTGEGGEEADNSEGMVYVFRGKKIFRKFDDVDERDAGDLPEDLGEGELRRRIGHAASRPLQRASIKPRLLWPSKTENAADDDVDQEEAPTDIEDMDHHQDSGKGKNVDFVTEPQSSSSRSRHLYKDSVTSHIPAKSAVRRLKFSKTSTSISETVHGDMELAEEVVAAEEQEEEVTERVIVHKASPFDSWRRSKSGQSYKGKGTKREVDIMGAAEDEVGAKRAKNRSGRPAVDI